MGVVTWERKESRLILCQLDWATGSVGVQLNESICGGVWVREADRPPWDGARHPGHHTEQMAEQERDLSRPGPLPAGTAVSLCFRLRLEHPPSSLLSLQTSHFYISTVPWAHSLEEISFEHGEEQKAKKFRAVILKHFSLRTLLHSKNYWRFPRVFGCMDSSYICHIRS